MGIVGILCILAGAAALFGVQGTPFALVLLAVGMLALVIAVAEHHDDNQHDNQHHFLH